MVRRHPPAQDGRVPRLLVLWTRPQHLSATEADAWIRAEIDRLRAVRGVRELELTRLATASLAEPREWDWMLELRPVPGADPGLCVQSPAWRDWVGDLRLLGMRPTVLLADTAGVLYPHAAS